MIIRPECMSCLTVVSHHRTFAFVKLEAGQGENYFAKPPLYLQDDWRWKCERELAISEARFWVEDDSIQGQVRYEGILYVFGPSSETYKLLYDFPVLARLAYKWLWMQVKEHDLNLKMKNQEVYNYPE